jgi:flagellar motility protein MotE (MotC chaperone)
MVLQTNLAHQEAQQMLSSKFRTAAVALIAASSFAATSAVPAVSQAKPINPYRSVTTKAAVNKKVTSGCAEAREYLNEALQNLENAHKEENKENIEKYRGIANLEYEFGFEMGCGFAG